MALVPVSNDLSEQTQQREGRTAFAEKCKTALDAVEKSSASQSERTTAEKAIEAAQSWLKSNPTAKVSAVEEKSKEMGGVVDPIVMKANLDTFCKEVMAMLSIKNFESSESAAIEKAIAENESKAATTKEDFQAKFKALGDIVNPIMVQVNKRTGAVTGQMVYMRNGGYYFEADAPPTKARLLLEDSTGVVFIDLDECADDNSLAAIVEDLQQRVQRSNVNKCIVLTIEARPNHPAMIRHLLRSGAFMVGLRATGIPIMAVAHGECVGPAWSLLLASDYRIGVFGSTWHLPICSAPRCIQTLVGPVVAAELCLSTAVLDCHAMLELGILAQARPTFAEAKYAAYEMAKRLGTFPHVGLRQSLCLLNPLAEEYANAVADDPSIMMQVYPDDVVTNMNNYS